jgi:hypothetical protein
MYGQRPFDKARELVPTLKRDAVLFPPLLLDHVGPLPQLLAEHLPLKVDREGGHDVPAHYNRSGSVRTVGAGVARGRGPRGG